MSGAVSISCLWEAMLSSLITGLRELLVGAFPIGMGLHIFNEKIESWNYIETQEMNRQKGGMRNRIDWVSMNLNKNMPVKKLHYFTVYASDFNGSVHPYRLSG